MDKDSNIKTCFIVRFCKKLSNYRKNSREEHNIHHNIMSSSSSSTITSSSSSTKNGVSNYFYTGRGLNKNLNGSNSLATVPTMIDDSDNSPVSDNSVAFNVKTHNEIDDD